MDNICKSCGYCGTIKKKCAGTWGTELLLWIIGILTIPLAIGSIILPAAIVYSVYRIASERPSALNANQLMLFL